MSLRPFWLERYFARYEFQTPFLLGSSDCEAMRLDELLQLATAEDLKAWQSLRLGYTESAGLPELREFIAKEYAGVDEHQVMTAAPEEVIYLIMRTLLKPGDRVVTTYPGYQSLYEIAAGAGCEMLRWMPRETANGWKFETRELESLLKGGAKAVVLNFPHNPTGARSTAAEWAEIVRMVEDCGAWLISDEMYRGLEEAGDELAPAVNLTERAISIAGLSKAYGLAGLRCGWMVCRDGEVINAAKAYKDYTTICSSAPSERLALIAIKNAETLRERCRKILRNNRTRLTEFAGRHEKHLAMRWPDAGPVCFPRWLRGSASNFCERAAAEAGVMLLPSTVYEAGDAHVRIGFGRLSFNDALGRLEEYLSTIE